MQKKKLKTVKYISKNIIYIFPLHSYIHIYKYEYVKLLDKMSSNKKCRRPFERPLATAASSQSYFISLYRYQSIFTHIILISIVQFDERMLKVIEKTNHATTRVSNLYIRYLFLFFILFCFLILLSFSFEIQNSL